MAKRILISEIKIDRPPRRDQSDLPDLDPSALEQPIVLQDGLLIDGLRRVELAKELGYTELPYEDPQTLEEAAEVLGRLHPTPLKNWQRVYELMDYLRPLVVKRTEQIRRLHLARLAAGEPTVRTARHVRDLMSQAFGGLSATQFEGVRRVVKRAPPEIVEAMLSGKLTPSGAVGRMNRRGRFHHRVTDPEAQEALFASALQTLMSTVDSLWMLGPVALPKERLQELMRIFKRCRRDLTTIIHQLEEAENK